MVQKALHFTAKSLDQFLKRQFDLDESNVQLNNVVEADGSLHPKNENKVVISLINIEKETVRAYCVRNEQLSNGKYANGAPAVGYNLYILMTPYFDDYNESLKFLNAIILFFQTYPSFDANSSSIFPEGLFKLDFNIENLSYHEMHNLWTSIGAKYRPSVLYKSWLVSVESNEIKGFEPAVSQISNAVAS